MVAKGFKFDFTSGCKLVGNPTPTEATCTETKSSHLGKGIITSTVSVPATDTQSTLGIFPATLIVTDTGDFPVTSVATHTQPPFSSDTLVDVSATATEIPIVQTSDIMVTYENTTVTATNARGPFGNVTSAGYKNASTVTVTVLASPIPCRCECNCTETSPARSLDTLAPKVKNRAVKLAAPVAMLGGLVGGMFWM